MNKAERLVASIQQRDNCTHQAALQHIVANPHLATANNVSLVNIKKLDVTTIEGRDKVKRKFFHQVVQRCPHQQQLMQVLARMSRKRKVKDIVKQCMTYAWYSGFIDLFLLEICEMDHKLIEKKYSNDNKKKEHKMYKYLMMEHQLIRNFNFDKILLQRGRDLRGHVLNALERRLNPHMNKDDKGKLLLYPQTYEIDRNLLLCSAQIVTENYISNYSNSGSSSSNSNSVKGMTREEKQERASNVCHAFNTPDGCHVTNCGYEHVCYIDFMDNHKLFQCYTIINKNKVNSTDNKKDTQRQQQRQRRQPRQQQQQFFPTSGQKRTRAQRDQNYYGGGRNNNNNNNYNNNNNNNNDQTADIVQGPPGSNQIRVNGKWCKFQN